MPAAIDLRKRWSAIEPLSSASAPIRSSGEAADEPLGVDHRHAREVGVGRRRALGAALVDHAGRTAGAPPRTPRAPRQALVHRTASSSSAVSCGPRPRPRRAPSRRAPSAARRRARRRAPRGRPSQPSFSGPSRHDDRHPHVVEEQLVEGVLADHRPDLADLEARRSTSARAARRCPRWRATSRIGADEQVAVVGDRGVRRPDLLAVDDVLVAVEHGARAQRGRSEPASGSENPWHQTTSPRRSAAGASPSARRCRDAMIDGPIQLTFMYCGPRGSPIDHSSSPRMACCQGVAALPPYSAGQCGVSQPRSASAAAKPSS